MFKLKKLSADQIKKLPQNIQTEIQGIKDNSEDFDELYYDVFKDNDELLFSAAMKHLESNKKDESSKATKPNRGEVYKQLKAAFPDMTKANTKSESAYSTAEKKVKAKVKEIYGFSAEDVDSIARVFMTSKLPKGETASPKPPKKPTPKQPEKPAKPTPKQNAEKKPNEKTPQKPTPPKSKEGSSSKSPAKTPKTPSGSCAVDLEAEDVIVNVEKFIHENQWTGLLHSKEILGVYYTTTDEETQLLLKTANYKWGKKVEWHELCPTTLNKLKSVKEPRKGTYKRVAGFDVQAIKRLRTTGGPQRYKICVKWYRDFVECRKDGKCTDAQVKQNLSNAYQLCGDTIQKFEKQPTYMKDLYEEVKKAKPKNNKETYWQRFKRVVMMRKKAKRA